MKPLLELSSQQREELADLRPMVEECLQHYRLLLRKLETAHDQDALSLASVTAKNQLHGRRHNCGQHDQPGDARASGNRISRLA